MTFALKTAVGMAALSFALVGCASAPDPSPRLLAAESSFQMAQADAATNEFRDALRSTRRKSRSSMRGTST